MLLAKFFRGLLSGKDTARRCCCTGLWDRALTFGRSPTNGRKPSRTGVSCCRICGDTAIRLVWDGRENTSVFAADIFATLDAHDDFSDCRQNLVTVVGHSFGGRVALAATALFAERLEEVVMLDIAPGPVSYSESRGALDILLGRPPRCLDGMT